MPEGRQATELAAEHSRSADSVFVSAQGTTRQRELSFVPFQFQILLVSSSEGHESEIAKAWCLDGEQTADPFPCTIVRYDF